MRRLAAAALRHAQDLALYRSLGRRLPLPFTIAGATPSEMAAVQRRLDPDSPAPPIAASDGATNWVALLCGRVVGFVQYVHHPPAHGVWAGDWLFSLVVWGRYRGLGIGEALTRQVIGHAWREGVDELRLVVEEQNGRAIQLYRKLGFAQEDVPQLRQYLADQRGRSGKSSIVMVARRTGPRP